MEIKISDSRSIGEIQEEFEKRYPYLKIEFYKNMSNGDTPAKPRLIPGKTLIGMVRTAKKDSTVNIEAQRTVGDVEKDFYNTQALLVQVFRKSGNMWIETTLTDHWSLQRQNSEGQQMS